MGIRSVEAQAMPRKHSCVVSARKPYFSMPSLAIASSLARSYEGRYRRGEDATQHFEVNDDLRDEDGNDRDTV